MPSRGGVARAAGTGAVHGSQTNADRQKNNADRQMSKNSSTSSEKNRFQRSHTKGMKEHHVFPWILCKRGHENELYTPTEVAKNHGVPENVLVSYFDVEIKQMGNLMSLPGAMVLAILFACMSLTHLAMERPNSYEWAIDFDIDENANFAFTSPGNMGHKALQDVNTLGDFWSWLNKGFMPLSNIHDAPVSEDSNLTLGQVDDRWFLFHNRKIGPIRLAQEAVEGMDCPNVKMADTWGVTCSQQRTLDLLLEPPEASIQDAPFFEDMSKTVWLNGFQAASKQRLRELEVQGWVNPRVARAQISLLTYNADMDLLGMTNINFLFAGSGRWFKRITHRTVRLTVYHAWYEYIPDALFFLQVTFMMVMELKDLASNVMQNPMRPWQGLWNYIGIWNLIDWVTICMSYIILGLWIQRMFMVSEMQDDVLALPSSAWSCTTDCSHYFAKLFDRIGEVGLFVSDSSYIRAFTPFVILLRLFKSFSAQPRLGLVTKTLGMAADGLAHYLIVFTTIFFSYTVMAIAFFGRKDSEISTLERAIPRLFRAVVGDIDFDHMAVNGRPIAFFFFLTFSMLVVLVMLSMLIAIMMDVYADVKAHAKSTESLWAETYELVRRKVRMWQGKRLALIQVRALLLQSRPEGQSDLTVLFPNTLMERVPGLTMTQAMRVLEGSIHDWALENTEEVKLEEVQEAIDEALHDLSGLRQRYLGRCSSMKFTPVSACGVMTSEGSLPASEPMPLYGSGEETTTAAPGALTPQDLALSMPLEDLLHAVALRIEAGTMVPKFPGSNEMFQQGISSARRMCTALKGAAIV